MRIVHLVWNFRPGPEGGTERQCWKQASALNRRGVQSIVLTSWSLFSASRNAHRGGITICRRGILCPLFAILKRIHFIIRKNIRRSSADTPIPRKVRNPKNCLGSRPNHDILSPVRYLSYLSFIIEATVFLIRRRASIEVIHVHGACWLAGYSYFMGRLLGIKSVAKESVFPVMRAFSPDVPFSRMWHALRPLNNYIALHNSIAEDLVSYGVHKSRIWLIPNGVEIPNYHSPLDSQRVLMVANLSQGAIQKGFDVLLEAWTYVIARVKGSRLIIAGRGDSTYWNERALGLGIESSVAFLGHIDEPDALYANSSVFVLPSRLEGLSNSLLEALAWGIPCVVSSIPGNLVAVRDYENGITVPPEDPMALSEAIVDLLTDDVLRSRLGRNARLSAIEGFSLDAIAEDLISMYGGLTLG